VFSVHGDKVRGSKRLSNGGHEETGMKKKDVSFLLYIYICIGAIFSCPGLGTANT
jgi:hypothetical protein